MDLPMPSLPIEIHLAILHHIAAGDSTALDGTAGPSREVISFKGGGKVTAGVGSPQEREVLERVGVRKRAEAQDCLRRCAKVCWAWKEMATPLLYNNPILHHATTQLFPLLITLARDPDSTPPPVHHLTSLTILPTLVSADASSAETQRRLPMDILHLLTAPIDSYPALVRLSLPPNLLSSATPFTIPGGHARLWSALATLAPRLVSVHGLCLRRTRATSGHTRYLNAFLAECVRLEEVEIRLETAYSAYVDHRLALTRTTGHLAGGLRRVTIVYSTAEEVAASGGAGPGAKNVLQPVLSAIEGGALERAELLVIRGLDGRRETEHWVVGDGGIRIREAIGMIQSWVEDGQGAREVRFEEVIGGTSVVDDWVDGGRIDSQAIAR